MFKAFVTLFSQADALFFVLFALTLFLFILNFFVYSSGIIAIGGFLMGICAITERCVSSNNTANQILFYIIWFIVIIFVVVALFKLIFQSILDRKNKKSSMVVKGNIVPSTEQGNPDYSFLLGKTGVVTSDLKPSGKVEIDGSIYDVTTSKDYIFSGSEVKVVKVYASKVVVKKL